MTSRDVVNVVQRRLRKIKVGHAGTLDPMAEGVLVLGVGPAVRLVPFVQQYPKQYRGTFRLGVCSPSEDIESELSEPQGMAVPTLDELTVAASRMIGRIEQTPPAYSAIHIDGKRAYERVRAGEVFEMPTRQVDVHSFEILRYEYPEVEIEVRCGSGTYIRSLGVDLAKAVGTVAVMTQLRRLAIGPFREDQAISIDQLRNDDLAPSLLPAVLAVQPLPRLIVDATECDKLGYGQCIEGEPQAPTEDWAVGDIEANQVAAITQDGQLRAIVRRRGSAWQPFRVFPLAAS